VPRSRNEEEVGLSSVLVVMPYSTITTISVEWAKAGYVFFVLFYDARLLDLTPGGTSCNLQIESQTEPALL
jgi:hypothetical protein